MGDVQTEVVVLTALTSDATPLPAGSSWYTVHEPATIGGDDTMAAYVGPPTAIPQSAPAEAKSPAVLLSREDRASARARWRSTC